MLGNKSLLERSINIRASDYRFEDKIKYYKGLKNSGKLKNKKTQLQELISLTTRSDFQEADIIERNRTTKLFCGLCGTMMVGVGGTSKTGKVHHSH